MRALLVVLGGLVLAGAVGAAGGTVTVLPKPLFNAPARELTAQHVTFRVVSSTLLDPGRPATALKPSHLRIEGPDGTTRHIVATGRYAFDFRKYAWPPRIAPGEREFVYEQVVWAKEADTGLLYVETAHSTYARSSYGLNAYLNAIDLKTKKLQWRSPALVANADDFVLLNEVIVSGYGFTDEPDYLYAIDRGSGRVVGRLLLPNAAERIVRRGNTLTVDTYDHRLTVRVLER